jgi:ABC-type uncharacterized transport system involved in gliding motility auxiliary subunit
MNPKFKKFAPIGLYISSIAAISAFGFYIVLRQFNWQIQIMLGLIVLGISLSVMLDPQKTREILTGRQGKYNSNALILTIAVVGILAVINFLGYTNSKRWDLTQDKQNSLTSETIEILSRLPGKVTVIGFFSQLYPKDEATRMLENYKASSNGNLDYKFIDPDADPLAAQNANITRDGTLIFELDNRSEQVTFVDEREFSGAILRLSNPEERNVYFLTGHGEYELKGTAQEKYALVRNALEAKNYTVQTLNLLITPAIPENALAIIIANDKISITDKETVLLKDFLDQGKAIVWLKNPSVETGAKLDEDALSSYLNSDWGITINEDLVLDPNVTPPTITIADHYGNHSITNKLQGLVTIFPGARSVKYNDNKENIVGYPLVSTSQTAWGETELDSVSDQQVSLNEEKDNIGPVNVAIAAKNIVTNGRLVLIGDAEFATDNNFTQYGNGTLLINTIDWAAGQEDLIDLTPRENIQRVLLPPTVFSNGVVLLVTVFLIPGLILMAGIIVGIQRKKRG